MTGMKFLGICCVLWLGFLGVNEERLSWREDFKLTWTDFKGEPKSDSEAAAVTASGISFSYSITESKKGIETFTTKVEAHFYPKKSWVLKQEATTHILGHEQLHFDITELHVRKFRKALGKLKVSKSLKADIDSLHKSVNEELAKTQKQYDTESDYSRNLEAQARWRQLVAHELEKLKDFKSKD
ncbi:DUF922 domain-containing protein [Mangrovimonas sp. TPBH4]|uniref:DUF922 domain-containing protein n=1 Tax=Mangrovimonas sp. TPBH4 TaxID=1645914 RepID=UPI0009EB2711|nr:DUF922 domain-containing protein [Mangrovimonas sp. TPBH4]